MKGSLIIDTYDDCYEIGIYEKKTHKEEWAYWLKHKRPLFSTEGGFIILSPPLLGKWK